VNHRAFAPGADAPRLATFHCSTGTAFEDDVERWINTEAVAWLTDVPYNLFQRRNLELVEGDDGELIAVVAW